MSDQRLLPPAEAAVWSPDPLLSGRGRGQTPNFLRTQWDEATARRFGPWRVADPVEPTNAQTATALLPEPLEAQSLQAQATDAETEPSPEAAEPQSAWSDAAIAALREQAHQQGVQEGMRLAQEQWESERLKEKELLRHLGIELRSLQQDPQRFFEPLRRLALHIAEQWVRGELQVSGRVVEQLVRQCLEQLEPTGQGAHVELHPDDLQRLQALDEEIGKHWQLQADPQLRPGSVRVRVNETMVQDLIEHRLEAMARKLLREPDAWLQQSGLMHPEKLTPVDDDQEALRQWSRRTVEVEDATVKHANAQAEAEPGSTPPPAQEM